MELANMWISIVVDDEKFQQAMKNAQQKLEGLKGRMEAAERSSKALAKGLAVISTALLAAGLKSLKMAGDLEQTKIAFTTMLGSAEAADAFIKQLYDFAAKTPFEIEGLTTAARQLLAFGFQAEQIIPMMEAIGNAVSGLGGGAFEIERVTRALGQMQAKGKVSAEEMMQLAELGIPVWEILAEKIGVSIPEAMDKASNGGISAAQGINALLEGMNERFPDMMEKQSESLLGIWSNFQDNISQIFTKIGEDLIDTFGLKGKLKTVVESLDQLRELIGEKGLQGALEQVSIIAKTAIVAIAGAITAALIPVFVALAKAIWAAMAPLLPFMAIGAAVAALAYLIYKSWASNMFGIQDKVKMTGVVISSAFQTAIAAVMTAFNKLKTVAFNVLQSIMNAVSPVVGVLGKVAPGLEEAFGRAQKAMKEKGDAVSKEAEKQAAAMRAAAGNLKVSSKAMKEAFSDWSTPKMDLSLPKMPTAAPSVGPGAMPTAGSGIDEVAESMANAASKGSKAAGELRAAWEETTERLNTRMQQIRATFDIAGNQMAMTGTKAEQLKTQIESLNAQIEVQEQIVVETTKAYEQMKAEKGENSEEAEKLKLKVLEEQKALSDLGKQLFDTKNALRDQAQELRNLAAEVKKVEKTYRDDLAKALEDYTKKVADTNFRLREETARLQEEYAKRTEDITSQLAEQERRLTEQYEQNLQNRARALMDFVGLFEEVTRREVSGETLLANLEGQVGAFEDWQRDIQALVARGIDEGLLQELRQMGPKAGPEIAALNTLTDEQLSQYVTLWKQKQELARQEATTQLAKQREEMNQKLFEIRQDAQNQLEAQRRELAQKLEEMQTKAREELEKYKQEWEKKNEEIRKNAEEKIKDIHTRFQALVDKSTTYGVNLMDNFIGGIESQFDRLRKTLEAMAEMVDSYMPHSPAKVGPLKRLGEWGPALVKTFADGIKASLPKLENAMAGMAALTPAAIGPSISTSSTSNNYGGNTFHIHVSGGSAREQAEDIMRELHRLGVRF